MIKEQVTTTQWNDLRIVKPTSRLYQTKPVSMQTVVRLPVDATSENLRMSGHNANKLFTRAFVEKDGPAVSTSIHTNLWLGVKTFVEARMKYAAMLVN